MNKLTMAIVAAGLSGLAAQASAQWGTDAGSNLKVGDHAGEQVQPKIGASPDGGCFISWFDSGSVNYKSDTWIWSGTAWTKQAATGPSARVGHAMAFDSATGKTVLFGGADAVGTVLSDTWEWDGSAWAVNNGGGPSARQGHVLAYDAARNQVVLFGGVDGSSALKGDTWLYNGVAWSQASPASSPTARKDASAAYDPIRGVVVLFGGEDGSGKQADTWEWTGSNWAFISLPSAPSNRSLHTLAFDPITGRVVLFGGSDTNSAAMQDTYLYDGATWSTVTPTATPAVRFGGSMANESHTGTVNSNVVATVSPSPAVAGQNVTVSYNPVGRPLAAAVQVNMHYGYNNWGTIVGTDAAMVYNAGAARWQATILLPANASQLDVNFNDGLGTQDTNTNADWHYDLTGTRTVVFSGNSGTFNVGNMSEWNGFNWVNRTSTPTARTYAAMAYDSTRAQTVLFGGIDQGGYDVYVQRLNAAGFEQFAHNGLQIADRGVSSTVDYDMIVDSGGNAIVAWNDDQIAPGGTQQVVVAKVSLAGSIVWKTVVTSGTTGTANPHVVQLSDGSYVVGYSYSTSPQTWQFQRLDASGVPQLSGNGVSVAEASHYLALSDLKPSGTGFVAMWVRGSNTSPTTSNKGLYLQKYDTSGAAQWNSGVPTIVWAGDATHSIQNGYFPTMRADGADGVVVGWYSTSTPRNAYIQHVLSDGSLKFGSPTASTGPTAPATRMRIGAGLAYNTVTGEYYLASTDATISPQGNYGVIVQKFSPAGALLWTDSGATVLAPNAGGQPSFEQCQVQGGGCMVFFMDTRSATTRIIDSARLDSTGTVVWHNLVNNDSGTDKSRLTSAMSTQGFAMLAYGWGASGAADMAAQNVNPDGSLGYIPTCYANCDESTVPPILNANDFQCFLNRFAASEAYANCDGSVVAPILNANDFQCFLNAYAAGCN